MTAQSLSWVPQGCAGAPPSLVPFGDLPGLRALFLARLSPQVSPGSVSSASGRHAASYWACALVFVPFAWLLLRMCMVEGPPPVRRLGFYCACARQRRVPLTACRSPGDPRSQFPGRVGSPTFLPLRDSCPLGGCGCPLGCL